MANEIIEKSFCTTREAAGLLGVSVGTVQLWVESGLLQAWKTAGGHRRVLRESVERLLHKRSPQLDVGVSVPAGKEPALPAGAGPLAEEPRHLRMMVVEDDVDLLRLYQVMIRQWPIKVDLVLMDSAVSALMAMGRGGPDLLVSDLHMPGMDGFSMLKVLCSAPEMAHTTFVVVTGLDAADVQAGGGVPPGVEVLGKPIPFARLQAIAESLVQRLGLLTR